MFSKNLSSYSIVFILQPRVWSFSGSTILHSLSKECKIVLTALQAFLISRHPSFSTPLSLGIFIFLKTWAFFCIFLFPHRICPSLFVFILLACSWILTSVFSDSTWVWHIVSLVNFILQWLTVIPSSLRNLILFFAKYFNFTGVFFSNSFFFAGILCRLLLQRL